MTSRILYTNGSREKTLLSANNHVESNHKFNGFLRPIGDGNRILQAPVEKRQLKTNPAGSNPWSNMIAERGNGESFVQYLLQSKSSYFSDARETSRKVIDDPFQQQRSKLISASFDGDPRRRVVAAVGSESKRPSATDADRSYVAPSAAVGDSEFRDQSTKDSQRKAVAKFEAEQTEYCQKADQLMQFARMDSDSVKNLCLPNEAEKFCQLRIEALGFMGDFLCRKRTDAEKDPEAYLPPEAQQFRADVIEVTVRAFCEIVVDHNAVGPRTNPVVAGVNNDDGSDGPLSGKNGPVEDFDNNQRWHWYRCPMYELFIDFVSHPFFVPASADAALRAHITPSMVARFLQQFYSERDEELKLAKDALHRMYAVMTTQRRKFREKMNALLLNVTYENPYCAGVKEILEVYSAIICGFVKPLKREHIMFFVRVLLPLIKSTTFVCFHEYWLANVLLFFDFDEALTGPVLDALLLYWPRQDGQKQVIFACLLEEILNQTPAPIILQFTSRLFSLFARCIRSHHLALVERILLLFGNDYIMQVFMGAEAVVMPIFFREIYPAIMDHKQAYACSNRRTAALPPLTDIRLRSSNSSAPPTAAGTFCKWNEWDVLMKKFDQFLEKFEQLSPQLYMKLACASPYPVFARQLQSSNLNGSPQAAALVAAKAAEAAAVHRRREIIWQRIETHRQFPFRGTFLVSNNSASIGSCNRSRSCSFRGYYHNFESLSADTSQAMPATKPTTALSCEDGRDSHNNSPSDAKSNNGLDKNKNSPHKKRKKLAVSTSGAENGTVSSRVAPVRTKGCGNNQNKSYSMLHIAADQRNGTDAPRSLAALSQNNNNNGGAAATYADKAAQLPRAVANGSRDSAGVTKVLADNQQGTLPSANHKLQKWYNEW